MYPNPCSTSTLAWEVYLRNYYIYAYKYNLVIAINTSSPATNITIFLIGIPAS